MSLLQEIQKFGLADCPSNRAFTDQRMAELCELMKNEKNPQIRDKYWDELIDLKHYWGDNHAN